MAQSVHRVREEDSLNWHVDPSGADGGLIDLMDGKMGEKKTMRLLLRDSTKTRSGPRQQDRRLPRRSIKKQPHQHQQQWETETASTCTSSLSGNGGKPLKESIEFAQEETQRTYPQGSLHDAEIILSQHKELLQHQHQQRSRMNLNHSQQFLPTERYDAHRRHDLGEVRRKGTKNFFDFDPPAAKAYYYHYQNQRNDINGNNDDDDIDSDESDSEAEEENDTKSLNSGRSARPWHRPNQQNGGGENFVDVAAKDNKGHDNKANGHDHIIDNRDDDINISTSMSKKNERYFSRESSTCEIEKAESALALFFNSPDSSGEENSEDDEQQQHQEDHSRKNRKDISRPTMTRNPSGARNVFTSSKSMAISRRQLKFQQPLSLFQLFDWYFGTQSSGSTNGKKKKKKRKGKKGKIAPLFTCKEHESYFIASRINIEKKVKQKPQKGIQKHDLVVAQKMMRRSQEARRKLPKDTINETKTATTHSEKETPQESKHYENHLGVLLERGNDGQFDTNTSPLGEKSNDILAESLKYDEKPSALPMNTGEELRISPSLTNKRCEQQKRHDKDLDHVKNMEKSLQKSSHDSIMKFLTTAPTNPDDPLGTTASLFDTPTPFDSSRNGSSLFGDGDSSLFGDI